MNTKRQTIWLVSMLSLMVILSAYYLFTEDLDPSSSKVANNGTTTEQTTGVQGATEASTGSKDDAIVVNEVNGSTQTQTDDNATADTEDISAADQKTLDQLESQDKATATTNNVFNDLQYKRNEQFQKESDQLWAVIANTTGASTEEAGQAVTKLDALSDKMDRINALEEELNKLYPIAVVDDQDSRYKIVVQSEKLERGQAADIIDLVTKTLEVSPSQVVVQYVP
ncbi:stage III sporulation protein AH [Paenibacillus cellulosilyticus]|uniref:Stage III sporulation protein AH n=1 Tax=Paenibacillus cellulosilyticus TaxID=375489 RepID=A0A2V2YW43_9BACL|nr:SpoIIIAH-like family protein [Paenibacillus cellulosilyticus]PWW05657.1 stage III sporulation protein AH [Paenibacillus cellulosilyticus]QKS45318.1 SpoIIIAH-like family protein [Paenibacillus cellulosilyticus]